MIKYMECVHGVGYWDGETVSCEKCRTEDLEAKVERLQEDHKARVEGLREQLADADRYGDHMAALMTHVDKPASCVVCNSPATCIGWCLDDGVEAMCDDHCGHGNEDSVCYPVPPTRAEVERLRGELDVANKTIDGLPTTKDGVPHLPFDDDRTFYAVWQYEGEVAWRVSECRTPDLDDFTLGHGWSIEGREDECYVQGVYHDRAKAAQAAGGENGM